MDDQEEDDFDKKKALKELLKDYPSVSLFSFIVKIVQYFFTGIILLCGLIGAFYAFFIMESPVEHPFIVELLGRIFGLALYLVIVALYAMLTFCFFGLLVDLALAIVRTEVNTRK